MNWHEPALLVLHAQGCAGAVERYFGEARATPWELGVPKLLQNAMPLPLPCRCNAATDQITRMAVAVVAVAGVAPLA